MYKYYNPNPESKNTGDCTVRAICKALGMSWHSVYTALCAKGFEMHEMPDTNAVWGGYLLDCGFVRRMLPSVCPLCYNIADFASDHPDGTYIVGTGTHVVCVHNGDIYDSWDSSERAPIYYFSKEE